jgi:large subunit ribosomal protein L5
MEKTDVYKKIEKAVINVGVGRMRNQTQFEEKVLPEVVRDLSLITGQKPAPRATKKAIASFKTRTGDVVGLQVTLRGARMRNFVIKVTRIILPRVKDFRGLEMSNVDSNGNLNIGFREQYVFPEVDVEKSKIAFGFQVTIVPVLKNREKAIDFYRSIGVPLKKI